MLMAQASRQGVGGLTRISVTDYTDGEAGRPLSNRGSGGIMGMQPRSAGSELDKEAARMGSMITVQMPEDVLVEALRRLPEGRRRAILRQLMGLEGLKPRWVPVAELGRLIGLVSLGGDAVQDTEALYNG